MKIIALASLLLAFPAMANDVAPVLEQYRQQRVLGEVWKRPQLSARDRSIVTLAALVSRQQLEGARREQAEAVNAYRAAVEVSNDRYRAGKASYYEVLEAQQQLFPAENALSQIEASQRLVLVQFYKALGGGWNLDDLKWTGAQTPVNRTP